MSLGDRTYCIFALFAQPVKLCSVIGKLGPKVLDSFEGLLLFFWNELLL